MNRDILLSWLKYDAETGVFYWLQTPKNHRTKAGNMAGTLNKYLYITILGKKFAAHRLAWFFIYGVWPKHQIDHIDGNTINNCIHNLRDVTNSVNQHNRRKANATNKSTGILGVTFSQRDGRYIAKIVVNNKCQNLGSFLSADDARIAYNEAKIICDRGESLETYRAASRQTRDNASRGIMMSLGNETMCMADWERRLRVSSGALRRRINRGWNLEKTLTTKRSNRGRPLKPDGRPDMHISTGPGDLDLAGRPLKPGR